MLTGPHVFWNPVLKLHPISAGSFYPTMVCQISRGLGVSVSVANAATAANSDGAGFAVVSGMQAVDAKNEAVKVADFYNAGLVLVEDDVLPSQNQWSECIPSMRLAYGEAITRSGKINTRRGRDGKVLYTGTCLVAIPRFVLDKLPRPVFRSWKFTVSHGELVDLGPGTDGRASDVYFWHLLRKTLPDLTWHSLGRVPHVRHALSEPRHDLQNPSDLSLWEEGKP